MKVPFILLPTSWNLKGKFYKRAKLEYYHEGEQLDRRLVNLDFFEDVIENKKQHLYIDKKYNIISDEELERRLVDIDYEEELKIKINELSKKLNKKDLNKEILNVKYQIQNEIKRKNLYIDLEYGKISNEEFDEKLKEINKEN